jgi:hypothetical protein
MAALSVRAIFIATAFAVATTIAAAETTLADFQIFGVKPADDANAATLVEIGAAEVEPAKLNALVATLPVDLWGSVSAASDTNAEAALCSNACASRALCRSITYDPPTKDRPIGVCHLKTGAAQTFGKMAPVDDATETKPVAQTEADAIPPPPLLTITVEPMPIPPRAVAEAPPVSIVPAPKAAPAKVTQAKPAPRERRRYMPAWVVFAMLAFVIGGALLYRRNYFVRQRKAGITPVPSGPIAHDLAA